MKQIDRDNFQSYVDKLSDAPSLVYFELCRLKNKDKKSNNHLKCDLLKTKAYYKEHFHDHPSNWEPIQHCVTKKENDCANEMFTFDNVKHAAHTVNAHKTSADSIPSKALKYLTDNAITLLQSIFIQCYLEGSVPSHWQNSAIVEVFKSGNFGDPGRFRPITLIAAVYKIYQQM